MLVFKHFLRDIYDEVKIYKQQIWKRSNYQYEKKKSFQPEVCKLSNERNAIVLASVKYFSK